MKKIVVVFLLGLLVKEINGTKHDIPRPRTTVTGTSSDSGGKSDIPATVVAATTHINRTVTKTESVGRPGTTTTKVNFPSSGLVKVTNGGKLNTISAAANVTANQSHNSVKVTSGGKLNTTSTVANVTANQSSGLVNVTNVGNPKTTSTEAVAAVQAQAATTKQTTKHSSGSVNVTNVVKPTTASAKAADTATTQSNAKVTETTTKEDKKLTTSVPTTHVATTHVATTQSNVTVVEASGDGIPIKPSPEIVENPPFVENPPLTGSGVTEESSSSNFPVLFLFSILAIVGGYFLYHNKSKLLGLIIEGRSASKSPRSSPRYSRLKNVEEAMPGMRNTKHV